MQFSSLKFPVWWTRVQIDRGSVYWSSSYWSGFVLARVPWFAWHLRDFRTSPLVPTGFEGLFFNWQPRALFYRTDGTRSFKFLMHALLILWLLIIWLLILWLLISGYWTQDSIDRPSCRYSCMLCCGKIVLSSLHFLYRLNDYDLWLYVPTYYL